MSELLKSFYGQMPMLWGPKAVIEGQMRFFYVLGIIIPQMHYYEGRLPPSFRVPLKSSDSDDKYKNFFFLLALIMV